MSGQSASRSPVGDDYRRIGVAHRERRAALDSGRAVAEDPVELLAQFRNNAGNAVLGQSILVAGLRRWKQGQRFDALVADQRLGKLDRTLHHIDEVIDHAPFGTHDKVEIAQSDIEIDDHDVLPALCKSCAEGSCRGRFTDAALAGCDDTTFDIPFLLVRSIECRDHERVAAEPCLRAPPTQVDIDFVGGAVVAVDRQ